MTLTSDIRHPFRFKDSVITSSSYRLWCRLDEIRGFVIIVTSGSTLATVVSPNSSSFWPTHLKLARKYLQTMMSCKNMPRNLPLFHWLLLLRLVFMPWKDVALHFKRWGFKGSLGLTSLRFSSMVRGSMHNFAQGRVARFLHSSWREWSWNSLFSSVQTGTTVASGPFFWCGFFLSYFWEERMLFCGSNGWNAWVQFWLAMKHSQWSLYAMVRLWFLPISWNGYPLQRVLLLFFICGDFPFSSSNQTGTTYTTWASDITRAVSSFVCLTHNFATNMGSRP